MTPPPAPAPEVEARRRHYGGFYGLAPVVDDGRPVAVVWGNCQAESTRVLLGEGLQTVRVPPVHEITADDLPFLAALMARVDVLVGQPVAPGWRGLPLGTSEVAALAPGRIRLVRFPVIRHAGLYPFQAIVRVPGGAEPPVVPYHDLRTLTAAAGVPLDPRRFTATAFRAVARESLEQLRAREERHGTVVVSDLLAPAGAGAAHTVNHPGNAVLSGLAARVQEVLGLPVAVPDPGRTLLRSVFAPQRPDVLAALGIDAPGREDWLVDGMPVPDDEVRAAQLEWYGAHPEAVAAGLQRHAPVLRLLAGA